MTHRIFVCFFRDGEPLYASVARSRTESISLAIAFFGVTWKALKDRGIRCMAASLSATMSEHLKRNGEGK